MSTNATDDRLMLSPDGSFCDFFRADQLASLSGWTDVTWLSPELIQKLTADRMAVPRQMH
jgi:hypothetical protein